MESRGVTAQSENATASKAAIDRVVQLTWLRSPGKRHGGAGQVISNWIGWLSMKGSTLEAQIRCQRPVLLPYDVASRSVLV